MLYFLDHAGLDQLATDIATRWPKAEIICVTWRGDTGNPLQGEEALNGFAKALDTHAFTCVSATEDYRIDRAFPEGDR
ncbi:hypothetical protein [Sulfitobacter faviae]|uniref:hypothetical protein n=1 Tax=Sulfitobacter faviae TaxID=1775881 RepID=UPI00245484AB|nr:hypothetical protein [Sulfitobacter faviae]